VGVNSRTSDVSQANPYGTLVRTQTRVSVPKTIFTLGTLAITLDFLLIRLPLTFSSPDVLSLSTVFGISGAVGVASGVVIGVLARNYLLQNLGLGFLIAALLAELCPWLYWISFDGRIPYVPVFAFQPFVSGLVVGGLVIGVAARVLRATTPDRLLQKVISPGTLPLASVFLFALACSQSFVGLLLYGSLMGAILLGISASLIFTGQPAPAHAWNRWGNRLSVLVVLFLTAASALFAWRVLPLAVIRSSVHRIVHFARGKTRDLRVTSGQDAFHVFEGNRLRFTTLDQHRWAEALTQPALSRLHCPKKALVFSLGEGLAERELLKVPCVQSITSIVRDRISVDAGRRQYWWRRTIDNAWNSSRVHVIERDPAAFAMDASEEKFDLAIIDLPDPENFVDTKYYTRFFYRQLTKRLTSASLLATQATSALRTPKTFASIRATLDAAGYTTLPYHVELTTLGDWYFILASPSAAPILGLPSPAGAVYSFTIPPDAAPHLVGRVNRLENAATLDTFLEETGGEPLFDDESP
jgi:spermidine synthase